MSIEIRDLCFGYCTREVLRNVSFSALEGQILAVLGPNGVGKTTLFRCILGLQHQYSGSIAVDGIDARNLSARELAHRVAYIPQTHGMAFNYSVLDMKYVQPLPDKPGFLLPITGMTYFPAWDIRVDVNHILCDPDNFARLPMEVQRAKNLTLLLETAVELARRKASFEPGIVVPQGYQGKVQFLLPLCLLDTEHTDLAMTLTPMDGYYLGHTCLTLEMAYMNARLIGRPVAPWLLELVT